MIPKNSSYSIWPNGAGDQPIWVAVWWLCSAVHSLLLRFKITLSSFLNSLHTDISERYSIVCSAAVCQIDPPHTALFRFGGSFSEIRQYIVASVRSLDWYLGLLLYIYCLSGRVKNFEIPLCTTLFPPAVVYITAMPVLFLCPKKKGSQFIGLSQL